MSTGATGSTGPYYTPGIYTWDSETSSPEIIYVAKNRIKNPNNKGQLGAFIISPSLNNALGGSLSWSYSPNGVFTGRFKVGLSPVRSILDTNLWKYSIYCDNNNNCAIILGSTNPIGFFSINPTDVLTIVLTSSTILFYKSSSATPIYTTPNTTGATPLYASFYM